MNSTQLVWLGLVIIFVGFFVVLAGSLIGSSGSSSTGGFILIGPFPIVFGSGPDSGALASVALAVSAVMIVLYLLSFFVWGRGRPRETEVGTKSE